MKAIRISTTRYSVCTKLDYWYCISVCNDKELVNTIKILQSEVVGWKRLPDVSHFQQQPQIMHSQESKLSYYIKTPPLPNQTLEHLKYTYLTQFYFIKPERTKISFLLFKTFSNMLNNLRAAYFYVGPAWELETHYLWYLRIHQLYRPIELKFRYCFLPDIFFVCTCTLKSSLQFVQYPVLIFLTWEFVPAIPPGYRSVHASPLEQHCVSSPVPVAWISAH